MRTSQEIKSEGQVRNFRKFKLVKCWTQSFLVGGRRTRRWCTGCRSFRSETFLRLAVWANFLFLSLPADDEADYEQPENHPRGWVGVEIKYPEISTPLFTI